MQISLRHFSPGEFRCKDGCGGGIEHMNQDLLMMLDQVRDRAGIPLVLSSAYRCPAHNQAVGGVDDSAHTRGYAAAELYRLRRNGVGGHEQRIRPADRY